MGRFRILVQIVTGFKVLLALVTVTDARAAGRKPPQQNDGDHDGAEQSGSTEHSIARSSKGREEVMAMELSWAQYQAKGFGELTLQWSGRGLRNLWFSNRVPADIPGKREPLPTSWERALGRYFLGKAETFADITLDVNHGTAFQQHVWTQLRQVPFGSTTSYGDLARALGKPGASRAVGNANGRNPIPILVPCHRVIQGDGSLGGFTGGLSWKRKLLRLEGSLSA